MKPPTPVDLVRPVLERLPVLPDMAHVIQPAARAIGIAYALGATGQIPRLRRGGSIKAERSLAKLRDQLVAVNNTIQTMPIEAHDAVAAEVELAEQQRKANEAQGIYRVRDKVHHPLIFDHYLVALAYAVEAARRSIAEAPPTQSRTPKKNGARAAADQAAWAFETLTGRPATVRTRDGKAYGPFLDLVRELFQVLGVDGEPEGFAREACRKRRARAPIKEKRARKKATVTPLASPPDV